MTRVLITGANGHLGANIVRALQRHGHEVVAFVRPTSDLRSLAGLRLEYAYGDILDAPSVEAALAGCDVLIHTAAVYRFWARRAEEIVRPALEGTRNVLQAAQAAGVSRVVYTSTSFAVGASADPESRLTAADWNDERHMAYTVAKTGAERDAWEIAAELALPLIVFCPNGILGPLDYGLTPTTRYLRDLLDGSGRTMRGGASFVDVRDVAEVHARAVTLGEAGSRYLVAGEPHTLRQFGQAIAALTGIEPGHMEVGKRLALPVAALMELAGRLQSKEPQLTRDFVREVADRYHYFDCEPTWNTFGLRPRPQAEMLADAIRWLLHIDALSPKVAGQLRPKLPPDPAWAPAAG